jgi:hypothetical protein
MAWPFGGGAAAASPSAVVPAAVEATVAAAEQTPPVAMRSKARTLPFAAGRGEPAPRQALGPGAFSGLRQEGQRPVPNAWEEQASTLVTTLPGAVRDASADFAREVARREAQPPPLMVLGPPPMVTPPAPAPAGPPGIEIPPWLEERVAKAPIAASPAPATPAVAPAAKPPTDAERVAAIQREVWRGDRSLAAILEEHGLTELQWRALRRSTGR